MVKPLNTVVAVITGGITNVVPLLTTTLRSTVAPLETVTPLAMAPARRVNRPPLSTAPLMASPLELTTS